MGKLTISMAMFNSYVSLPEGTFLDPGDLVISLGPPTSGHLPPPGEKQHRELVKFCPSMAHVFDVF